MLRIGAALALVALAVLKFAGFLGRPRRVLVSYAHGAPKFFEFQRENCFKAKALGVDECMFYDQASLGAEYYERNRETLSSPLGAGFWSWKAMVIFLSLNKLSDGDIVFYMDSGSFLTGDPAPLFALAEKVDIVIFSECQWQVGQWSTRTSLVLTDGERFRNKSMVVAGYSLWKKTARSYLFLAEWLTYLQDRRIVSGDRVPGIAIDEFPEFREHRHDMVPLIVSAYRWRLKLHRAPYQYTLPEASHKLPGCKAEYPDDTYETIIREM